MERYVRWFVELPRFYRIMTTLALAVGVAAVATGLGTGNAAFLAVGAFWLFGATAAVAVAAANER